MSDRVGGPQGVGNQGGMNISQATDVTCVVCGSPYFLEGVRIKKLSVILSPTGKEEYFNMQTLLCMSCGHEMGQPTPDRTPTKEEN